MVRVLTLHIASEDVVTACSGMSIGHKAAIQAAKALAALAADLITNAAYPSYAIQQTAASPRRLCYLLYKTQSVVLMTEPRPSAMLSQPWESGR